MGKDLVPIVTPQTVEVTDPRTGKTLEVELCVEESGCGCDIYHGCYTIYRLSCSVRMYNKGGMKEDL